MIYKYIAYSADKKLVEGKIDVASENLAETTLYRAGFENIISLEEATPGLNIEWLLPSLFGIKSREIIDTSNQLATLIQSGITLSSALKLLEDQTTKKALKKVLSGLIEEIQAGNSLSQALTLYPQVFPNTYCQTIKASEQAGTLEVGLKQAAKYLEKQSHANQKITRAMLYPTFVLLMAIGVAILLTVVALPPLTNFFASLNAAPGLDLHGGLDVFKGLDENLDGVLLHLVLDYIHRFIEDGFGYALLPLEHHDVDELGHQFAVVLGIGQNVSL